MRRHCSKPNLQETRVELMVFARRITLFACLLGVKEASKSTVTPDKGQPPGMAWRRRSGAGALGGFQSQV